MPICTTGGRVLLRRGVARASLPMPHIAMRSTPSHSAKLLRSNGSIWSDDALGAHLRY
jgi:hypothetical protein